MSSTQTKWICTQEGGARLLVGAGFYFIEDEFGKEVARVQVPIHNSPRTGAETEAIVRLIASAPEMLQALEATLQRLRDLREDLPLKDTKANHERILAIGEQARAAIARARGQS